MENLIDRLDLFDFPELFRSTLEVGSLHSLRYLFKEVGGGAIFLIFQLSVDDIMML